MTSKTLLGEKIEDSDNQQTGTNSSCFNEQVAMRRCNKGSATENL